MDINNRSRDELLAEIEDLRSRLRHAERSEEALRLSEERYRTLFDTMIEGFCVIEMIFDADGTPVDYRFLETNPAFERETGLQNVQGKFRHDLHYPRDSHWAELCGKVALTGEPVRTEYEAKALGRHYDLCAFRIGGAESRKVAILFNDISKRKYAEELVANQAAELDMLYATAPVGLFFFDSDLRYLRVNNTMAQLNGLPPEEHIGRSLNDLLTPELAHAVEPLLRQVMLSGEPLLDQEVRGATSPRPNEQREWLVSYYPVHDRNGAVRGVQGVVQEITERKRAEEAEILAKQEWERTFDTVPDLIAILDNEHRIVRVNRAMAEWIGLKAEECVGQLCYKAIHGADSPPEACPHSKTLADGREHEGEIERGRAANHFLVTTTPLLSSDGKIHGVVHVARNITERKRAEKEIQRLNADLSAYAVRLEAANSELEAFNYTVAHDLRKPLAVINGYAQAIKEFCAAHLDEECTGYVQDIYDGSLRMNRLIETLLEFSRLAHAEPRARRLDLAEISREIIAELKLAEPERSVRVVIPGELPAEGDPDLLRVVLGNLVGNAWKYSANREDAVIEVGATETGGTRSYFVRDNGRGFDPAEAGKLFVPFHRLGGKEVGGMGVGLATVERIIRRHGGRVWAEGEPGKGATFHFTLGEERGLER